MNVEMRKVVQASHFKRLAPFCLICGAMKEEWGPLCNNRVISGLWRPNRFALRLQTVIESVFSSGELED